MKKQADAKEDRERKKNDPVELAKKLALALHKELATLHVSQLDVARSRATNDQKTLYKKKSETFGKELTKARGKLLKADATNAEDCMHEGKTVQEKIKDAQGEVKLLHKLANM